MLICNDIGLILQLNRAFLGQIVDRMRLFTSKTPIADIFLSFLPHFKMYTAYCCKYSQITETVARLKTENKAFKSFVKKLEVTTKHPIADFLIAPVQRVPRLSLLIESLIKFTDETHPDYNSLKQALEESQNAARLINDKMKEVEVRAKVVSIHKSFDAMVDDFLDGPLVQPHRVFVYEGVLAKKNSGSRVNDDDWSDSEEDEDDKQEECEKGKYYCFLFNDLFLVGTSIGKGKTKRLAYETSFELSTTFIREDMNGLCFQMVNPRCTYTWLAQSTGDVAEWKRVVEETVESLLKQHPNLSAQRKRVNVTLDHETNEWSAEIRAIPKTAVIDPVSYREEVLENTQKHLTQFMHEHHEKLIKHRATLGSPKKAPGSVFQRVKESLTPKKSRTSVKVGAMGAFGDENNSNGSYFGSPIGGGGASGFGSPISASMRESFSLSHSGSFLSSSNASITHSGHMSCNNISNLAGNNMVGGGTGSRKSEKVSDFTPVEEMDGITCINRHLEMLQQELAAVREARRTARAGGNTLNVNSNNGSRHTLSTSPVRRLTRVESMAAPSMPSSAPAMRRHDTLAQLGNKSVIVDPLPPAPTSPPTLSRKKSKSLKNNQNIEKRQTLAIIGGSSASARRSTVVVPPTPASPISMMPRAADTESIVTRKSTPKAKRGRMSLGGDSSKLLSKAPLPPPLYI